MKNGLNDANKKLCSGQGGPEMPSSQEGREAHLDSSISYIEGINLSYTIAGFSAVCAQWWLLRGPRGKFPHALRAVWNESTDCNPLRFWS